MKTSLNTVQSTLEQFFGFTEVPRALEGGLSHEVYSLDKSQVIVKVYSSEVSAERLDAEQKALTMLATSSQINAPKLIPSKMGEYRLPIDLTCLSCFRKIQGERRFLLTEAPRELNQIADIGRYLGMLHKALSAGSTNLTPKISPIFEVARTIESYATEVDRIVSDLMKNQAPYFITHGDFQQSNLLYLGEAISGVIDFEYSTPDFRVTDIAGCLSNLLSANSNFLCDKKLVSIFKMSYEESNGLPLLQIEKDILGKLIEIFWRVNLFWVDLRLKANCRSDQLGLLALYRSQTKNCIATLKAIKTY